MLIDSAEFYFSDSNLPHDKFLWTATTKNHGWIPIATLATFKRMRKFNGDLKFLADALRKSTDMLEVDDKGEKVRRRTPLLHPAEQKKRIQRGEAVAPVERSIYVKGFPVLDSEPADYQLVLEKWVGAQVQKHGLGKVNLVRMRRTDDKKFKGSVFVEFAELSDQKKFLENGPYHFDEKLASDGSGNDSSSSSEAPALEIMSKKAYVDLKAEEYAKNPDKPGRKPAFNAYREMTQRKSGRDKSSVRSHSQKKDSKPVASQESGEKPAEDGNGTLSDKPEADAELRDSDLKRKREAEEEDGPARKV